MYFEAPNINFGENTPPTTAADYILTGIFGLQAHLCFVFIYKEPCVSPTVDVVGYLCMLPYGDFMSTFANLTLRFFIYRLNS